MFANIQIPEIRLSSCHFYPFLQGRTDRTSRTLTVESCLASPRTVGSRVLFSPMEASECGLRFVTLQTIRNTLLCINVDHIICNYMNI